MNRRTLSVMVVGVAAAGWAGIGCASASTMNAPEAQTATSTQASRALPTRTQAALRALQTATKSTPGGRAYDLEYERFQGRWGWEVKLAVGVQRPHKLRVSADGRRVLQRARHRRHDDSVRALQAKVPLARAIRIADGQARGLLDDAEIDRFRGRLVWEVTFKQPALRREHEVIVNAATGVVMRVKTERDD